MIFARTPAPRTTCWHRFRHRRNEEWHDSSRGMLKSWSAIDRLDLSPNRHSRDIGMDYARFERMSDEELVKFDIAELNLLCAKGLPGSEVLDIRGCLDRLSEWTDRIRSATQSAFRHKASDANYREMSEPRFRMVCLALMLQNHLGLKYSGVAYDAAMPYDGSDSREQFIHGILSSNYRACCCTAPVLYVAIARRLGYPLKLVKTIKHLYCRWDDPQGERFNVEATNLGMYTHPDEYYCTWPETVPTVLVRHGVLLRSLTPREELALFIANRGLCLIDNLRPAEALKPLYYACQLDPNDPYHRFRWMIATMMHRAAENAMRELGTLDEYSWRIPVPRKPWERYIYATSCRELNRIRSNRETKRLFGLDKITSETIVSPT